MQLWVVIVYLQHNVVVLAVRASNGDSFAIRKDEILFVNKIQVLHIWHKICQCINSLLPNDTIWHHDLCELSISL